MLSTLQCDSVVPPYNWKQPVLVVTPMGSNYDQYGERAFNQADRFNLIEGMERRKLPKMILKLSEAQATTMIRWVYPELKGPCRK